VVQIVTTVGPVVVNDDSISRVVPRTPDFPYAHVWGPAGSGPLEVVEEASALVARLQIATPLVTLTTPGGEPVWIKGAAVTLCRQATPFEHGTKVPFINSIAIVAGRTQGLLEDVNTSRARLVAGGAHLPEPLMTISTVHGEVGGFSPKAVASSDVFQVW
jgi:hypothetical protein